MSLYIDPPNAAGHGRMWSHLASDDSFEELHRFAASLGIPGRGFDHDHYDIPSERYAEVIAAGAVPISSRELVVRLHDAGLRRRKRPRTARTPRGLLRAHRLHPGDTVAVVAPAGPVPEDRVRAGLATLSGWDLQVRVGPHVLGRQPETDYLAAADADRAADFMAAWTDPQVQAVFCARGGYGVQRMVDLLDWSAIAAAGPKVLVGFSDITALHQAFAARLGMSTVHGPVVTSLARDDDSAEHLRTLLFEPEALGSLTPVPTETMVSGSAEGPLAGGNLALLATSAGTRDWYPARGAIAVLEDVGEEVYRIDRMLTQLLRAGWFDGVRGIVLGRFTESGDPDDIVRLAHDRLVPLGVPMVREAAIGHDRTNLAFPLGGPARLDADKGTLTLTAPPLL
ncbi:MAG TPA: DUF4031 domain-containing protein [Nocardioidaceae bacterium]|jgi:muramoyltetrapeptide carboxypeptidase|nr:DUF4031 domain-containing protein [Nocardioidaceae bacterium]